MRRRLVAALLLLLIALLLVPLIGVGGTWSTLLGRTVQDFGHLPLFGMISTLLLLVLSKLYGPEAPVGRQYLIAFAIAVTLGVATELAQMVGPRDADLQDLLRNLSGTFAALSLAATVDPRIRVGWIGRRPLRWGLRLAALVVVAVMALPLVRVVDGYLARSARMPTLYAFSESKERAFVRGRFGWIKGVEQPDCWGEGAPPFAAEIRFGTKVGPAIVFNEPYPDWSEFTMLALEICLPGDQPVTLGLRIDDQHRSVRYTDRYNRHLNLQPGVNRIRISLDEVGRGPAERPLDLTMLERIVLFPVEPAGGYGFFLAPIELQATELVRR